MESFGVINFWQYVLGCFFIILLPGPNSMFVLSVSLRNGYKPALRAAGAIMVGDTILMVLSAVGSGALMRTNETLFHAMKIIGACYLAYIGVRLLISIWQDIRGLKSEPLQTAVEEMRQTSGFFRKALVISLLNPKAIFFFLSFFVQFVDPKYEYPTISFMVLACVIWTFSWIYLSVLIIGGNKLKAYFVRNRPFGWILESAVALMFIGFALRLAVSKI